MLKIKGLARHYPPRP